MNETLEPLIHLAINSFQEGDFDGSETALVKALQIDAKCLPALHILGLIKASQNQHVSAAEYFKRACAINPEDASIQYNLAKALSEVGSDEESLPHHEKATQLMPENKEAWLNYGKSLSNINQLEGALASYEKAIALDVNYCDAWQNKGLVLYLLSRYDDALSSFEQVLRRKPEFAEAWGNAANAFSKLEKYTEALASYDRALGIQPKYAEAWHNKALVLQDLKRHEEAITAYKKATAFKPDYAEAWTGLGALYYGLKQYSKALESTDEALKILPNFTPALHNKAVIFSEMKLYSEALEIFKQTYKSDPGLGKLLGDLIYTKMLMNKWDDLEEEIDGLAKKVSLGEQVVTPFALMAMVDAPDIQLQAAKVWVNTRHPQKKIPQIKPQQIKKKICIAYISPDFRNHPVAHLIAGMFEAHDKDKFEIFALSTQPVDASDGMRNRLKACFDHFYDIAEKSDIEVAKLCNQLGIDIAIDLCGHTQFGRTSIFSYRAAPIQVNYLGYPGSMGASYMDYIIADHTIIPKENQPFFTEKIVYLPNSYQVNDTKRKVSDRVFTRSELGLPEKGFVFCCFNNNFKITPHTFDSWARILKEVPGSVLWLLEDNALAKANLIKEAQSRGLSEDRLVFAGRLELSEHLARHRQADLFIDTIPCNAHTTASDALWVGLPVLTLLGKSFAGRVAASLLTAIGMPELITHTPEEYEAVAIDLAKNPEKLKALKEKLETNRLTTPLFNTQLITKQIESAYQQMYERYQAGMQAENLELS